MLSILIVVALAFSAPQAAATLTEADFAAFIEQPDLAQLRRIQFHCRKPDGERRIRFYEWFDRHWKEIEVHPSDLLIRALITFRVDCSDAHFSEELNDALGTSLLLKNPSGLVQALAEEKLLENKRGPGLIRQFAGSFGEEFVDCDKECLLRMQAFFDAKIRALETLESTKGDEKRAHAALLRAVRAAKEAQFMTLADEPAKLAAVAEKRASAWPKAMTATCGIEWVRIPRGRFSMSDEPWGGPRRVQIKTFELAKAPVTVCQYRACVAAGACTPPGCASSLFERDDQPVVCVDWDQARKFSVWAGGRLPSEAEWEFAARSAGRDRKYPWGDEEATCQRAVMDDGDGPGCGLHSTWPVCSKPQGNTDQGVCDMAGNVHEWVQDWFRRSFNMYGGLPQDGSAWEEPRGTFRIVRGGSWSGEALSLRAAARVDVSPTSGSRNVGFRPARNVD